MNEPAALNWFIYHSKQEILCTSDETVLHMQLATVYGTMIITVSGVLLREVALKVCIETRPYADH